MNQTERSTNLTDTELHKFPDSASSHQPDPERRKEYLANLSAFETELQRLLADGAQNTYTAVEVINMAVEKVRTVPRNPGLVNHLAEISAYSRDWQAILATKLNKNGQPYLTPDQLELITEVVAPLHDVVKFLGDYGSQTISEHERVMANIIRTYFGEFGYYPEEVVFMASIVGDHENIFQEEDRAQFASSKDPVERGKALFFTLDTLTGVVSQQKYGLDIDQAKLEERFIDLYFRHLDLKKGKEYRPQWGLATVRDYQAFFSELQTKYGVELEDNLIEKIIDGAITAVNRALQASDERSDDEAQYKFSADQLAQLQQVKTELLKLVLTNGFEEMSYFLDDEEYDLADLELIREIMTLPTDTFVMMRNNFDDKFVEGKTIARFKKELTFTDNPDSQRYYQLMIQLMEKHDAVLAFNLTHKFNFKKRKR